MKKFLSLVLALVMTMSLVTVSASAADDGFKDADKINNTEAVEVLSAMGVIGGYADGTFRPQATLTRGAGAKFIAYLMLGQEKADKLAATYTIFKDVDDTVGLAAYIEWAAANGIVDGYGDGNFGPYNTLTEYAFGKMLLTALGYDSAKEGFTGAGWQKNVYRLAAKNGVFDGTETWGACDRETAARMALGALKAKVVVYGDTKLKGQFIWNGIELVGNFGNVSVSGVLETTYRLYTFYDGLGYEPVAFDSFGRLGHAWSYDDADFDQFYMDTPVSEYTKEVTVCDALVDAGIPKTSDKKVAFLRFSAGMINNEIVSSSSSSSLPINLTYTHSDSCDDTFGGQGVLTQIFSLGDLIEKAANTSENAEDLVDYILEEVELDAENIYIVTEIYTALAQVVSVQEKTHKKAGESVLKVYLADSTLGFDKAESEHVYVTVDNAVDYEEDDYVLVNFGFFGLEYDYTRGNDSTDFFGIGTTPTGTSHDLEGALNISKIADEDLHDCTELFNMFTPYVLAELSRPDRPDVPFQELFPDELIFDRTLYIVGEPDVIENAKFTGVAKDLSQATVAGKRENTAYMYSLSASELDVDNFDKKYDFLVDQYGNIIGDVDPADAAFGYGVIERIAWQQGKTVEGDGYAEVLFYGADAKKDILNITKFDSTTLKNQNSDVKAGETVSQYYEDNGKWTSFADNNLGVVKNYGDGKLGALEAGTVAKAATNAAVEQGNPNITLDEEKVIADKNTVFLVKTEDENEKSVYASVTGYDKVPSISSADIVAVTEKDDTAATFVYIDATDAIFDGNSVFAVVLDADETYTEKGMTYAYDVYVNGEKVDYWYTGTTADCFEDGKGIYKLKMNADGEIIDAERISDGKERFNTDGLKTTSEVTDDTDVLKINDKAYVVTNAKVYALEYVTATDAEPSVAKDVIDVSVMELKDIDENCKVYYRESKDSAYVIDTLFVFVQVEE